MSEEIDNYGVKEKNDKLRIILTFNGKKVTMEEVGETAYPTYVAIMGNFAKKNEIA